MKGEQMATKAQLQEQIKELQAKNQEIMDSLWKQQEENYKLMETLEEKAGVTMWEHKQLKEENQKLNAELSLLKLKCDRLEREVEYWKSQKTEKPRNERNAGRKCKLSDEQVASVQMMRMQGMSYRKIADQLGYAVGTIHKICSEIK